MDGDQISVRIVFSQEANAEAEKILQSKINILNGNGSIKRPTTKEGIQTLYDMTK